MLLTLPDQFTASRRTIKNNHLFLVDDIHGHIPHGNDSGLGLYHLDTRFLSCLEIRLNDTVPVPLLSSTELGYLSTIVYTNGRMMSQDDAGNPCRVDEETIQLKRESLLNDSLLERFSLTNYNGRAVQIRVSFRFEADFRDIFEVRHLEPADRGQRQPPKLETINGAMVLVCPYVDGTGHLLETRIVLQDFKPASLDISPEGSVAMVYETLLTPMEPQYFHFEIQTAEGLRQDFPEKTSFESARLVVERMQESWNDEATRFITDNDDFNEMLARSHKDIRMLMTRTGETAYIAAGIPWYVCLFGRDSLITARDCLLLNPAIARHTLHILAKYQGREDNPWRDEEPGKILHELRVGELARSGEIPHTPYYGSVDATPLWIILLHDYVQWTGDWGTLRSLWPNALRALDWLDRNLAKNTSGYLTYLCQSPKGLYHQGWKDSNNSAMDAAGVYTEPPIALAEVQGYVYLARQCMVLMADWLKTDPISEVGFQSRLNQENLAFRERFNRDFWVERLDFCALGLDGQGKPLDVISSNPGHCLETGIFTPEHAARVADRMMAPDMYNGWGIRTLSSQMRSYNPMSYHNGSVWPHDNAMIARGLARMERSEAVEQVFSCLFEAARLMFYRRLPELFCGFSREPQKTDPPVRYPVACSPQAWASSAVFSLTQAMLNLNPDLPRNRLTIRRPRLPHWMKTLQIQRLRVGDALLDLEFRRTHKNVVVDVHERQGNLDLVLEL